MSYQDDLTAAQSALQGEIGKVAATGPVIADVKSRAGNYTTTSQADVNSQAQAVISKANGLQTNLASIQADAANASSQADAMKAQMATDPTWQILFSDPTALAASGGTRTLQVAQTYVGNAVALTQSLVSIKSRSDDHLAAVDQLKSDEADVEQLAAGKGIVANIKNIGAGVSHVADDTSTIIKYAAIAAIVFFGWDMVSPFLKAVAPRRRA